jgi:hypothetical protein
MLSRHSHHSDHSLTRSQRRTKRRPTMILLGGTRFDSYEISCRDNGCIVGGFWYIDSITSGSNTLLLEIWFSDASRNAGL